MFISDAVMRLGVMHGGDDAGLGIGPADHADPHLRAQLRIAAIGGNGERGLESLRRWKAAR